MSIMHRSTYAAPAYAIDKVMLTGAGRWTSLPV